MYDAYWQLKQKPFENGADPRFYYPGETHQAALLKLRYAIENRRGGALLAGPSGGGKTLLVQMLRQMASEELRPIVHIVYPQMTTADLLAFIAGELDGDRGAAGGVEHSVRRIERFLAENSRQGRHATLIIDEAHLIDDPATFEALRLLMNFEFEARAALTLLLVGQPAILPLLQRMPQLDERLAVKCLLRPFAPRETAEYVTHRLKTAGAVRTIIASDAMTTLHELTLGIPRRINRLCDLALLIGFAEERKMLSAAHFEAVAEELVGVKPE